MWIKNALKGSLLALAISALAYLNIILFQSAVFGWCILFVFLLWSSKIVHLFLIKYFQFSGSVRIKVLSSFLVLAILGFVTGILSLVSRFTPLTVSFSIFVCALSFSLLKKMIKFENEFLPEIEDDQKQVIEQVPSSKIGLALYLVLVSFAFYFLNISKTDIAIFTPWQTISVSYIYLFFAATFVLGYLLFSKLKSGMLLFLLIVHSVLLHAYLPLSHEFFYGADGWRHLAIQNSMLSLGVEKTLQFSIVPISFWQRFNFGSLAYAQFDSLALFFKMLCGLDLIVFLRYFVPVVWSVIFPILMYELARTFDWEKKRALFLVWFSLLPFALQASGSMSLPSNLSFLFWLLVLLLQFKNNQNYSLTGLITITILGTLSLFGHSLYVVLFGLSYILFLFLDSPKTINMIRRIRIITAIIFSVLLIPILELITNFSQLSSKIKLWPQIKAILGSFGAWYAATGLRASDITVGNIIFNQPPLSALVTNVFTINRLWICVFMLALWVAFVFGWNKLLNKQKNNFEIIWLILTVGLFGGYILSRYFLVGENILSRRLDAVLAVLFVLPVAYYLFDILIKQKNTLKQRSLLFFVIFVCSLTTTASYTLGPDIQVVSQSQFSAANYVWKEIKNSNDVPCVLSDTYTSLVLEGVSGKKVVGGGFPMNLYFSQPELNRLLIVSKTQPDQALFQAKKILNSNTCFLIGEYNLPDPIIKFGEIKVYKN